MASVFRDVVLKCSEGPEWLARKNARDAGSSSHQKQLVTKARVVWCALHLVTLHLLLTLGNSKEKSSSSVPFPSASEQTMFLCAIVINALTYFTASFANPGFVMPPLGAFPNDKTTTTMMMRQNFFAKTWASSSSSSSSSKGAAALGAHTDGPKNSNASTIDTTTITTNTHNSNSHRECVHCQPPVFQPIRAKHCFACNRCVRKFDHHCHWISNCVGEKNHGKFLLFLTTQFIVVSWGLLACLRTFEYYSDSEENSGGVIPRRRRKPSNFAELVANNGWSAFATFLFFLFTVFVGALFFTHWYLVLSARTTYELLAARHKVWYLPRKKTTPPPPPPPPPLREFTRSPFTAGTGCKGAFFNVKRTLCIDSALPHDVGVKWIVPDDAVLAERDAEETCFDNAQYSCC